MFSILPYDSDKLPCSKPKEPVWKELKPIKCRIWITHNTPSEREIIEEIIVKNDGDDDVGDFPIPMSAFHLGLRVLDEDDSILTFYPREEILTLLQNCPAKVKEKIQKLMEDGYLLWLKLPKNKPICKGDMRSIRLSYWGSGLGNPIRIKSSMFDIQEYSEYLGNSIGIETSYFISAPKDCNVELVGNKTYGVDIDKRDILSIGIPSNPATPFHELGSEKPTDAPIIISNAPHYISIYIRQQKNPSAYIFQMAYQVKLPKYESRIWKIAIPLSTIFLIGLIFSGFLPNIPPNSLFCMTTTKISITSASIMTLGLVAGASIGALIALKNDPMIARTRVILFIQLLLIVLVIIMADSYFDTPHVCNHPIDKILKYSPR